MNTKFINSISMAVLAGIAFSGLSTNVHAADFSYNYVEGAYESTDLDGPDADVFRLSGSYELTPNVNVIGEYAAGDIDNPTGGSDLDFEETAIGLGYHTGIAPKTDVTANIKYINQDIDLVEDDNGYGVGVGVRHWLMDKVEVDADIDYVDVGDNEDTRLKLGARYHINESFSAGVGYSTSDNDVDVVSGNIRWNF
jgi:hypothetical protein